MSNRIQVFGILSPAIVIAWVSILHFVLWATSWAKVGWNFSSISNTIITLCFYRRFRFGCLIKRVKLNPVKRTREDLRSDHLKMWHCIIDDSSHSQKSEDQLVKWGSVIFFCRQVRHLLYKLIKHGEVFDLEKYWPHVSSFLEIVLFSQPYHLFDH